MRKILNKENWKRGQKSNGILLQKKRLVRKNNSQIYMSYLNKLVKIRALPQNIILINIKVFKLLHILTSSPTL